MAGLWFAIKRDIVMLEVGGGGGWLVTVESSWYARHPHITEMIGGEAAGFDGIIYYGLGLKD